jgi:CheY-like chemotaxis protein
LLTRAPNAQVRIGTLARDEVSVQAEHEGQYDLEGPDVSLSPKAAEILTLAVHELAANALKYGALSVPDGRVTVRWDTVEKRGVPWLIFDWSEQGAPQQPQMTNGNSPRRGFGSELIEARIPYELRGQGELVLEAGGARCHLEFPLSPGASVLETGAPQRATVFGGGLDMSGLPDLSGYRVLVIEDEYYIATDIARALRGAGATVSGPCPSEEAARIELVERRPDAIVLDINLGLGASFKLAETVKDHGIPFVFVTGYDQRKIPEEFKGIERLEKPTQLRHIVQAIGKLVGLPA